MKNYWLQKSKVFEIGNVVEYIGSGFDGFGSNNYIRGTVKIGTRMTVTAVHDGIGYTVDCLWFEGLRLKSAAFAPDVLRRIP